MLLHLAILLLRLFVERLRLESAKDAEIDGRRRVHGRASEEQIAPIGRAVRVGVDVQVGLKIEKKIAKQFICDDTYLGFNFMETLPQEIGLFLPRAAL